MKQPSIAVVGIGRLGSALSQRLSRAGYDVLEVARGDPIEKMGRATVVWFCVPDTLVAGVAGGVRTLNWKGKYAFHSSGVLTSDVLSPLRSAGASVASLHPLMTFVKGSVPELAGVPFAIEGDPAAARMARRIVRRLGAQPVAIKKENKIAYHTFATMVCPLLVSLLTASERVAALACISGPQARRRMMPIVCQTLRNYEKLGPAAAFSGPIVRGDAETIQAHLSVVRKLPAAKIVYSALAQSALEHLPNINRKEIARLLTRHGFRATDQPG